MAIRIKDISEKLKLSPSTVSRVLNNKRDLNAQGVPFISEKTIARVLKTAKAMGYRPNRAAKALAMGKTMQIALWVPDFTPHFFHELACGFRDCLKTSGYSVNLCELPSEASLQAPSPTSTSWLGINRSDMDGVILFGGNLVSDTNWEPTISGYDLTLPILNMGVVQYDGGLDYLKIDAYPAAVEAMEHLLKTNRNRIVQVLCVFEKWDGDPRYRAYVNVLEKAGKNPEFLEVDLDVSRNDSGRRGVCEYVKANGCPDAFFCAEDDIAIGVYKGLRDLGFKIPEDVAIIGFNGDAETEYFDPSISTIALPIDEICTQSWELLSRKMKKGNIPRQVRTVQAKFLSRRSSQGS